MPVTQELVDRFAKAFADFVNEAIQAVQEAAMDPAASTQPGGLLAWQTREIPLLEEQNRAIQKAVALFQIGETRTIVELADGAQGLGKQLDGFLLDFAGPKHAEALDQLSTDVVVTAYQLYIAAKTP